MARRLAFSRRPVEKCAAARPAFARIRSLATINSGKAVIRQFLPSREGFNYNTGHFGAGNTPGATRHQAGVTPQLPSRDLLMKFIVWLIRVLVFVLLLVLALSNTQPATLNFLAGYAWSAPLILIGLAFFVVGLLAGLVSAMPAVVRLRMENGRLKRELRVARETPVVVEQPPMPPLI
ncbi:putative membrane protein [Paraburkholderia sp. GAS333]